MQVGQEVPVLGEPIPNVPLPGVLPVHGDGSGGGGGGASVRLLQMSPPAAYLAAAAASGSLTVRLLLHSPAPQPARVLVLVEGLGAFSSAEASGEPLGGGLAPRARLLLKLPVQLDGGVQEVEVEVVLGAGELAGAGADGSEGVAAAESDAVGVLRVMMVGPEHGATGTVGGQQEEAGGPTPLVHWLTPLLLLPSAAAAEVHSVWEAMQLEAEGGPGPAEDEQLAPGAPWAVSPVLDETAAAATRLHQCTAWGQQGRGQEQESRGGESVGSPRHAGTMPPSGPSSELLASAEWQSYLWWSHLGPLLGDLAYALEVRRGMGQGRNEEAANPIWQALLPYLQENGMTHTLSLFERRSLLDHHTHRHQQPSTDAGAYLAAPRAYLLTRRQFPFPLPRPFSPPSLEGQYQQWRLKRLAHMTPYALLVFDASATLILLLRALVTQAPLPVGASPLPLRLVHIVVFMLLTTIADTLGLVVLYARAVRRPSNQQQEQEQEKDQEKQQQQQQQQEQGRAGEPLAGSPCTATAVAISPGDTVWYRRATCVTGWCCSAGH